MVHNLKKKKKKKTYRTSIVEFPYRFTMLRNLGVKRFGEFISNPLLKLRRSSRSKVRHWLLQITTTIFSIRRLNGPTIIVFALS